MDSSSSVGPRAHPVSSKRGKRSSDQPFELNLNVLPTKLIEQPLVTRVLRRHSVLWFHIRSRGGPQRHVRSDVRAEPAGAALALFAAALALFVVVCCIIVISCFVCVFVTPLHLIVTHGSTTCTVHCSFMHAHHMQRPRFNSRCHFMSACVSGHHLGRRLSQPKKILQDGRGVCVLCSRVFVSLRAHCCRAAGTFKVALDSIVSRIACASSDHAIRIIDWYSGQVFCCVAFCRVMQSNCAVCSSRVLVTVGTSSSIHFGFRAAGHH
jgi:hypothetical protein